MREKKHLSILCANTDGLRQACEEQGRYGIGARDNERRVPGRREGTFPPPWRAFIPSFNLALHTPFMQATMQISVTNGIVKQAKHRLKVAQAFKSNLYRDQTKIKKEYSVCVLGVCGKLHFRMSKKPASVMTGNSH